MVRRSSYVKTLVSFIDRCGEGYCNIVASNTSLTFAC